jgi:hypothetical protein
VREFSHIGIPTDSQREGETFLEEGGVHVTDFAASPYAIEYLRFEPDSPMPEQLKTTAHVAFKVDDLEAELADREVLIQPFSPMEGVKVAFILHDGVPVEFMQEA